MHSHHFWPLRLMPILLWILFPFSAAWGDDAAYQRGVEALSASRTVRDPDQRADLLRRADEELKAFIAGNTSHEKLPDAMSQRVSALTERAQVHALKSRAPSLSDMQRKREVATAETHYKEARRVALAAREVIRAKLLAAPANRDELRALYLQVRLVAAAVCEQHAELLDEGTMARRELLTLAAKEFQDIYQSYRTRLAGLYARMYQARCHIRLKEFEPALDCLDSLFELPDSPDVIRQLKVKASLIAADCWLDPAVKKYDRAIATMQPLLASAKDEEARSAEWIQLRLHTARAHKLTADALAEDARGNPETRRKQQASLAAALELARFALRVPGDHQARAKALVASISGGQDPAGESAKKSPKESPSGEAADQSPAATPAPVTEITTFDQARRAGREMLERLRAATVKSDKPASLESARQAVRLFELALDLVQADTPIDDVNVTRYLLCYAYYTSGDYEKAGEVGEFLARRFPKSAAARSAAKIAMAAYVNQQRETDKPRNKAAVARLSGICRHILATWPDDEIAVDAASTLVAVLARSDKLDGVAKYLQAIPAESPRRGESELMLGRAIWQSCLRELAKIDEPDDARSDAFLQRRTQARDLLATGLARPRTGPLQTSHALASLCLCQILVDQQDYARAVDLLEDKDVGPHTLVVADHRAAQGEMYDVETFKLATRAYRGIVESDTTDKETQRTAEEKLKQAIVELDRRRKEHRKASGGRISVELAPAERDDTKRSKTKE